MQGARYLLPFHINAVLCVVISIGRKRNLLGDNCNVFYLPFITSPNATYFKSTIYHISKFYTLFPNGCKREYICHSADKRIRSSRNWMQDNCKNWMQSGVILVTMLSYYHLSKRVHMWPVNQSIICLLSLSVSAKSLKCCESTFILKILFSHSWAEWREVKDKCCRFWSV